MFKFAADMFALDVSVADYWFRMLSGLTGSASEAVEAPELPKAIALNEVLCYDMYELMGSLK